MGLEPTFMDLDRHALPPEPPRFPAITSTDYTIIMPGIEDLSSDWITVKESIQYSRVSRSRLYSLIKDQNVRSFCLKRRGRPKAMRFISRASLDEFFSAQCAQPNELEYQ